MGCSKTHKQVGQHWICHCCDAVINPAELYSHGHSPGAGLSELWSDKQGRTAPSGKATSPCYAGEACEVSELKRAFIS